MHRIWTSSESLKIKNSVDLILDQGCGTGFIILDAFIEEMNKIGRGDTSWVAFKMNKA